MERLLNSGSADIQIEKWLQIHLSGAENSYIRHIYDAIIIDRCANY
jgi:hypothetical protein